MKTRRLFFGGLGLALTLAAGPARTAPPGRGPQDRAHDPRLDRVLTLSKEYCRRLENAALDFVCREEIKEEVFTPPGFEPDLVMPGDLGDGWSFSYRMPRKGYVRSLVYDYQFVRKAGRSVENRTLIKEDGFARDVKNAPLTTLSVRVENALFGPVGLLSEARQPEFDYRIVGRESVTGGPALVFDAVPRPEFAGSRCNGRIWILEGDGSIVKVEWEPTSVGNYQAVRETAAALNAEPSLVSLTEYGLVKNGIRFPSRDWTEEAYLPAQDKAKRYVRSKTTILYKDYKFFTVETDVKF